MSVERQAVLLAVLHEEAAVGIGHVVGRLARQRGGHVVGCRCSLPSISTNVPTGVSSIAIGDVFVRELFAVFLVAEPHAEAELFEHVEQQQAVADDGLQSLREASSASSGRGP